MGERTRIQSVQAGRNKKLERCKEESNEGWSHRPRKIRSTECQIVPHTTPYRGHLRMYLEGASVGICDELYVLA